MDNQAIRPGRSEYPFTLQLPPGLPQSFRSDHGSVIYLVEVPYPKSWAPEHVIKLEFQVGAHLDLNSVPREWSGPGRLSDKFR